MDVTILNGLLRPISLLLQYKNTGKTGDINAAFFSEPLRTRKLKTLVPIEFCKDGSEAYLPSVSVDVNPYPPPVVTGSHIDIVANIELAKAIEAGSKLELKMKYGALELPIPCLDVSIIFLIRANIFKCR